MGCVYWRCGCVGVGEVCVGDVCGGWGDRVRVRGGVKVRVGEFVCDEFWCGESDCGGDVFYVGVLFVGVFVVECVEIEDCE